MWEVCIQHEGLRASRVLHGSTQANVQWKADAQRLRWDARWTAEQRHEATTADLLTRQQLAIHGHSTARRLTADVAARRLALDSLLATSLQRGPFLYWDDLNDATPFHDLPAPRIPRPTPPQLMLQETDPTGRSLLDRLFHSRLAKKELAAGEHFARDLAAWHVAQSQTHWPTAGRTQHLHNQRADQIARHRTTQLAQHADVKELQVAFEAHEKSAVEFILAEVLSRSVYPSGFPAEATLQYIRSTRTLFVEYELPSISVWPTHRQVLYNPALNGLQQVPVSPAWRTSSYENALQQIALRALSELFTHDDAHALDRIMFNGHVRSVDRATGNTVHACVLSISVTHDAFTAIHLTHVDPRACFRRLKGLVSSNLAELVPVKPLLTLKPVEMAHPIPDENNDPDVPLDLASISRSDFDAIIREAIEREFRTGRSQLPLAAATHELGRDAIV